jgi:hypothetical protein
MYLGDIITRQSSDFFYNIQLNTGPFMKNQNLKALNYLKAFWKHKSSETAESFSFYRVSSILVKILCKKTDLNICDSFIIYSYYGELGVATHLIVHSRELLLLAGSQLN